MRERFILTFLFHIFAVSLVLFPKEIKGPVLGAISSVTIQLLDAVAFTLIICGSIFLYLNLFKFLTQQQNLQKNKDQQDRL